MTECLSLSVLAEEVARALSYHKTGNEGALVVTPLLYPGGSRVVVKLEESEKDYLVSDYGAGRREAELMGGYRLFTRIARDAAKRYSVRFDSDMMFDLDVPREALTMAVIAVANASQNAVEQTAERLSERRAADQREQLWEKLEKAFRTADVHRQAPVKGASSIWEFDAVVEWNGHQAIFDLVLPHTNAVNAAVAKFLDVRDLGSSAPERVAVVTETAETPHLPLLGRTAKIIPITSGLSAFRHAA